MVQESILTELKMLKTAVMFERLSHWWIEFSDKKLVIMFYHFTSQTIILIFG